MEYASVLAGEPWTDDPACTHKLLSGVARGVNDRTSDEGRSRLVPLIPSVIGLDSSDPEIDARIAIRTASMALPVVSEQRQRALAVGILVGRWYLAGIDPEYERRDPTGLFEDTRRALEATPGAASWAHSFVGEVKLNMKRYRKVSAPNVVRLSIVGLSEACVPDTDTRLFDMLAAVIADVTALTEPQPPAPDMPSKSSVTTVRI